MPIQRHSWPGNTSLKSFGVDFNMVSIGDSGGVWAGYAEDFSQIGIYLGDWVHLFFV